MVSNMAANSSSSQDTNPQNGQNHPFFVTFTPLTLCDHKTNTFQRQTLIESITEMNSLQLYFYAFLLYLQH